MRTSTKRALGIATAAIVAAAGAKDAGAQTVNRPFARDFRMESCTFANADSVNTFWPLTPGNWLKLEGYEGLNFVELLITALPATETISFTSIRGTPMTVVARVVEEREWVNSELIEVSLNWFARCTMTSDVFYFGEWVDIYQNGQVVSHDGSWRSGQNGAYPGVMMPGSFMPGARYFQEVASGVALDRGENVAMGLRVTTPYGTLSRCVSIEETTLLDPSDIGHKLYCEGIGVVQDESIQLVGRGQNLSTAPRGPRGATER